MRTLFVMDPLDRINVRGDSTYAMMLEARRRGWPVSWCTPDQLRVHKQTPWAWASDVEVQDSEPHFTPKAHVLTPLTAFDVVWMRKDPPFDMDYVFSTYILDLATPTALVLNDPRSIKAANEKMYALQWPDLCPPTTVTNRVADVVAFAEAHGRIVIKPWDGNGGRGVLVTEHGDRNLRSMAELLTQEGRAYAIVQRYLPEVRDEGDKRIILIDGEARGWFLRKPGGDDHRGNMHVGATVHACDLTDRDREICAALGPRLKNEGLVFVGIDVIGGFLTEINVTSPTGFHEIRRLQGLDLARELTDAVERLRSETTR
ncbi:MAG: glutathione synthase [Alphaproteobacteria bacterium]|nr:glutathione synthase [Alphaproteobacteria bacterium]